MKFKYEDFAIIHMRSWAILKSPNYTPKYIKLILIDNNDKSKKLKLILVSSPTMVTDSGNKFIIKPKSRSSHLNIKKKFNTVKRYILYTLKEKRLKR